MATNNKYENMMAYVSAQKKFAFHHVSVSPAQMFVRILKQQKLTKEGDTRTFKQQNHCNEEEKNELRIQVHVINTRNWIVGINNLRFRKKNSDLVLFYATQAERLIRYCNFYGVTCVMYLWDV